jgi:hypothetical protein
MRTLRIVFAVVALTAMLSAPAGALGTYRTISDTQYSMAYSFSSPCDSATLLNVLFDFNDLQQYAGQPGLTLHLLSATATEQIVGYDYDGMLFKGSAVVKRTLHRERGEMTFTTLAARQNNKLLPRIVSSSGWYRVVPAEADSGSVNCVQYYQLTVTDEPVGWLYHRFARQQVTDFFTRLEKLVRSRTE